MYYFTEPSHLNIIVKFIIPEVRTKSSVNKQKIKLVYRNLIISSSNNFLPVLGKQYLLCARVKSQKKLAKTRDVENVTKEIIDTLFPKDNICVLKGVQVEADIDNQEQVAVTIFECP